MATLRPRLTLQLTALTTSTIHKTFKEPTSSALSPAAKRPGTSSSLVSRSSLTPGPPLHFLPPKISPLNAAMKSLAPSKTSPAPKYTPIAKLSLSQRNYLLINKSASLPNSPKTSSASKKFAKKSIGDTPLKSPSRPARKSKNRS